MSAAVSACVTSGYEAAKAAAERIIADGNYDRDLSMDALIDYGKVSADYDVCYILAAYSVSIGQKGARKADLVRKLSAVTSQMFKVTYEVKEATVTIPPTKAGEAATSAIVEYAECTIHPFDSSAILTAFGIDPDALYGEFKIQTGDAIDRIATALKQTLYGATGRNSVPEITDAELIAFLTNLNCSSARKELIRVALSLVGKVPYFWGGKSAPGWNDEWNSPKLVTSVGSSSTGTLRPYGLDCSGFTDWVYKTALGKSLYDNGTWSQWDNSIAITEAELLPGDLGFLDKPGAVDVNHVLIYAGKDSAGVTMWVHCSSGAGGVALNSPTYVKYYRRVSGIELETQMVQSGTGAFSAQEVEWLAALVYYEARGMDSYCRELTAQVVINRIRSPKFPNTMKSVLMAPNQYGYGVSGATATLIFDGSYAGIMGTASWNACLKAAKKAASGTSVDEDGNAWPTNVLFQHSFENPNANGSGLFKTYRSGGYWMHFNYG
jgi:cell wall-associated NlpC family hydrolase